MKLLLTLLILLQLTIYSQNDKPCSAPESTQLDFWVGNWTAEWKGEAGKIETGTNTITKILGGCALQENFSTGDNSFTGTSISVYSPRKKTWQQTWADNTGAYLDFTGGMEGSNMILSRKAKDKDGNNIMQRMVFFNITKDSFDWSWESSKDDGVTWQLQWQIKYKRKS